MSTDYEKDAQWLKTVRKEVKVEKQQDLVITVEHVKFALAKTPKGLFNNYVTLNLGF